MGSVADTSFRPITDSLIVAHQKRVLGNLGEVAENPTLQEFELNRNTARSNVRSGAVSDSKLRAESKSSWGRLSSESYSFVD